MATNNSNQDKYKEALTLIYKILKIWISHNPLLIFEGCQMIWNISLPFLNERFNQSLLKPFTLASELLDDIQSNNYQLWI